MDNRNRIKCLEHIAPENSAIGTGLLPGLFMREELLSLLVVNFFLSFDSCKKAINVGLKGFIPISSGRTSPYFSDKQKIKSDIIKTGSQDVYKSNVTALAD